MSATLDLSELSSLEAMGIDPARVERFMASVAADLIKARINSGKDSRNQDIPKAKDKGAKQPLNRTGQLLKSIKVSRGKGKDRSPTITPTGTREDGASNFMVLAKTGYDVIQLTPQEERILAERTQDYIDKLLERDK